MGDVHITDLIDPEQLAALRAAAAGEPPAEEKRQFTAKERHDAPTMPGTDSYPIENLADLDNAIQAWGRSKPEDRDKLKRWLLTRARALKAPKETVDRIKALGGGGGGDGSKSTTGRGTSEDRVARMNAKDDAELEPLEVKDPGDPTGMEHKSDAAAQVLTVDDDTGIVEALVSVTGIEDRVKDVIEPGAYAETLSKREPIGVWSHDDKTWVARTEEARELMPGDPMFKGMKTMDGQPWPIDAGAVYVKSRFNLETPHGKAAYSDVKFFKGKTGWSIGYRVTQGHRNPRTGQRRIKALDWYEYSPVMVGAASQPMTLSVKSLAQPVDPDEATGFVDDEVVEALEPAELARYVELKESLGLEVKDRVRTAAGQARFGQPIGSVIVPDTLNKLSAGDVKVGMEVDFQGGAPGVGAKPVKGKVSKVSRDGSTVTLTVNGEDHKAPATSPITVTEGMPKDSPLRDADLAVMIKDAMRKGDKEEVAVIRRAAALPPEKRRGFLTTGEAGKNVTERGSDKPAGGVSEHAGSYKGPGRMELHVNADGTGLMRMTNGETRRLLASDVRAAVGGFSKYSSKPADAARAKPADKPSSSGGAGAPDLSKLSEPELEDLRATLEKRGDQRGADKVTSEMQDRTERYFAEQRAKNAARRKHGPAPSGVKPAAWEAANNESLDGLDPDDPKFAQVADREGIDKDDLVEAATAIEAADSARKPESRNPEAARERDQRADKRRDRERADDAAANAVTKDREKLAALNRRRRARGQAPLLRLPDSVKSLRLADTPDDVLDAYIDTDPTVELEEKRSRASLDSSPRSNWVENTGELPGYIREVARAIHQDHGTPLSRAIPIAIGRIKRWAAGGGDVTAATRAKAAKAVAEWEALKAKARAKFDSTLLNDLELKGVIADFESELDDWKAATAATPVTDDPVEDDFVDLFARGQELKSGLNLEVDISDLVAARNELDGVVPPFSESKAAVRRGEGPGARRRAEVRQQVQGAPGGAGGGYARIVRTEAGARRYGVRVGERYTPGQVRRDEAGKPRKRRSVEDDDTGVDLDPEGKVPERGQEGPVTKSAQEVLVRLGLLEPREDGSVHGKFGPRTEEAVREFQEDNGLPVTGKLTADTLSSIKTKDPGENGGSGSSTGGGSSGSSSSSSASGGTRAAGAPSRDRPPPGDRPAGDQDARIASWFSSLDRATQQRVLARARMISQVARTVRTR